VVLYTAGEIPATVTVPDLAGLTLRAALTELARQGLSGERRGVGSVIDQSPPPGTVVTRGEVVQVVLRDVPRRWSSGGS